MYVLHNSVGISKTGGDIFAITLRSSLDPPILTLIWTEGL
jgi:hypothetical protein